MENISSEIVRFQIYQYIWCSDLVFKEMGSVIFLKVNCRTPLPFMNIKLETEILNARTDYDQIY